MSAFVHDQAFRALELHDRVPAACIGAFVTRELRLQVMMVSRLEFTMRGTIVFATMVGNLCAVVAATIVATLALTIHHFQRLCFALRVENQYLTGHWIF